jgi:hypothetical protein
MLIRFRRSCYTALLAAGLIITGVQAQNDPASRRAAIEGMYPIMMHAMETKNFGRARNICDQAIMWEPQNPVHHYNLACIEAQAGGPRLPYAWGALELSIALGFDDAEHMRTDPDLLPLHSNPRFVDLVRKVSFNVSAGAAIASIEVPAPSAAKSAPVNAAPAPEPISSASFADDLPVGPYFMTRYTPATQTVEKSVWYFEAGGDVLSRVEAGLSAVDLNAHTGPRGKITRVENTVAITWADGGETRAKLERDGAGFTWDMSLFAPVVAFASARDAVGVYECVESLPPATGASVNQRLDLRADGTFIWEGVSFAGQPADSPAVTSGHNQTTTGRWELNEFSLRLTADNGLVYRRLVFPSDDDKSVIKPDRMFFAGLMFKRRP